MRVMDGGNSTPARRTSCSYHISPLPHTPPRLCFRNSILPLPLALPVPSVARYSEFYLSSPASFPSLRNSLNPSFSSPSGPGFPAFLSLALLASTPGAATLPHFLYYIPYFLSTSLCNCNTNSYCDLCWYQWRPSNRATRLLSPARFALHPATPRSDIMLYWIRVVTVIVWFARPDCQLKGGAARPALGTRNQAPSECLWTVIAGGGSFPWIYW